MFANDPIYPSLPATDLERAKRFYAEKLGLTPESEIPGGLFYRCGKDTRFAVFTSQGEASGTHTQAFWLVEDVESEVAALKARGVVFEEYDLPSLKTANSIATAGPIKGAWFKDSEGNLLSLGQFV
ncbi:MAG: VOC family protein [Chloroflexi bacterium]|nr:MAG: VOC family protein [Chloroflexota bacterium]